MRKIKSALIKENTIEASPYSTSVKSNLPVQMRKIKSASIEANTIEASPRKIFWDILLGLGLILIWMSVLLWNMGVLESILTLCTRTIISTIQEHLFGWVLIAILVWFCIAIGKFMAEMSELARVNLMGLIVFAPCVLCRVMCGCK
jgi:hypothetical protein